MQSLDRHVKRQHFDHQRFEELSVFVRAQQRVPEHARRDRIRSHVALVCPGPRCFGKIEPFEFDAAHRQHTEFLGTLEHALERLSRTDRMRHFLAVLLDHEVAEEERHAVVPRHVAMRAQVDPGKRIRVTFVPARHSRVVVTLVGHVPTEHDVAETEATLRSREKFILVHVFAAQHAVDVGHRNLDALAGFVANRVEDLLRGDVLRHVVAPRIARRALRGCRRARRDCNPARSAGRLAAMAQSAS